MQKHCYLQDNTFYMMKKYYHSYGIKVLYVGWQFKMFQYIVQSIFTVTTLEHLENISRKIVKPN